MWHVTSPGDLDWLESNLLGRYTFPVLLSHFGGYPLDRSRYARSTALLDHHPQLYLITSAVWFRPYLEAAVRSHPERVIFGSDSPLVDPKAARTTILELEVEEEAKSLVLSENLRFLTERVKRAQHQALLEGKDLLFPKLPETARDLEVQGFVVTNPDTFETTEVDQAKAFWREYEVKPWYQDYKPWAGLLAELVRDLEPASVLEFGCNQGRNLARIGQVRPQARLVGIDLNPQAIKTGREMTGLDLRVGDEQALWEFNQGRFDLVFTVSVLDHIPQIGPVIEALLHCADKYLFLLEVRLPLEGRVERHFDHRAGRARSSTQASYSWHLEKNLADHPRVWRMDSRPCYLHSASLGPYYRSHLIFLEPLS